VPGVFLLKGDGRCDGVDRGDKGARVSFLLEKKSVGTTKARRRGPAKNQNRVPIQQNRGWKSDYVFFSPACLLKKKPYPG